MIALVLKMNNIAILVLLGGFLVLRFATGRKKIIELEDKEIKPSISDGIMVGPKTHIGDTNIGGIPPTKSFQPIDDEIMHDFFGAFQREL